MTKKSLGKQIAEGLEQAIAFERGDIQAPVSRVALTARTADAEPAPSYTRERIARLREDLRLSQPVFAMALNVSPETVRAWEQGKRVPDGAALRLLQLTERHPSWVLDAIRERSVGTLHSEED